jgi:SAM-dependent methyltransferase
LRASREPEAPTETEQAKAIFDHAPVRRKACRHGAMMQQGPPMSDARDAPSLRSNVEHWKRLHEHDYFETHPSYNGLRDFGGHNEIAAVEMFTRFAPSMRVVVIGCGYGRETAHIAPRVAHVYGIEVSDVILDKAVRYLAGRGVANFTPVLAERYGTDIPAGIDLVFSVACMQFVTRDLVLDYFSTLARKLTTSGQFIVQFAEELEPDASNLDAELRVYEPAVSWTLPQLFELARRSGLRFREVRTYPIAEVTPARLWHWVLFTP